MAKKNGKNTQKDVVMAHENSVYDAFITKNSNEFDVFYNELALPGEGESRIKNHAEPDADYEYTIVRNGDIRDAKRPTLVAMQHPEYTYKKLAGSGKKRHMRTFIITLRGEGETRRFSSHRGEEFILVQKGSIKVILGEKEETLCAGDSIYYRSSIPHRMENLDPAESVLLAVLYGE